MPKETSVLLVTDLLLPLWRKRVRFLAGMKLETSQEHYGPNTNSVSLYYIPVDNIPPASQYKLTHTNILSYTGT